MEEAFYGLFRFFRALGGPAAAVAIVFATPDVSRDGGAIVVDGVLEGAITPAVRAVLLTGTPVELRYEARLESPSGVAVASDRAVLRLDVLTGAWSANGEAFASEQAAEARAVRYHLRFADPGRGPLALHVEASIDHPRGLDMRAAPQALWEHRIPYLEIRHMERMLR